MSDTPPMNPAPSLHPLDVRQALLAAGVDVPLVVIQEWSDDRRRLVLAQPDVLPTRGTLGEIEEVMQFLERGSHLSPSSGTLL